MASNDFEDRVARKVASAKETSEGGADPSPGGFGAYARRSLTTTSPTEKGAEFYHKLKQEGKLK